MWAAWDGSAHHGGHLFLRPPWAGAWKSKSRSLMEEGLLSLKIYYILEESIFVYSHPIYRRTGLFQGTCQEVPADGSRPLMKMLGCPALQQGHHLVLCVSPLGFGDPGAC